MGNLVFPSPSLFITRSRKESLSDVLCAGRRKMEEDEGQSA